MEAVGGVRVKERHFYAMIPQVFVRKYHLWPILWCACVLSHFNHVRLFETLWTVALQILLSMGFSRQEHWSGLPFPPPGDRTHSCLHLLHSQQILHPLNHLGSPFCDVAAPFPLNWIYMLGSRRGRCTGLPHSYPAQRLALPDRSCCFICMRIWKNPSWVRIHTHTNTHTIVLSNP